jgi:hypothetical protein
MATTEERLEKLFFLMQNGVITPEELEERKRSILAEARSQSGPTGTGPVPAGAPQHPSRVGVYRVL